MSMIILKKEDYFYFMSKNILKKPPGSVFTARAVILFCSCEDTAALGDNDIPL